MKKQQIKTKFFIRENNDKSGKVPDWSEIQENSIELENSQKIFEFCQFLSDLHKTEIRLATTTGVNNQGIYFNSKIN